MTGRFWRSWLDVVYEGPNWWHSRPLTSRSGRSNWVIADLIGKGKHIRTVPVPAWVKRTVDTWTAAAEISTGTIKPVGQALGRWDHTEGSLARSEGRRATRGYPDPCPPRLAPHMRSVVPPGGRRTGTKSNFSSATRRSRPQSATWAANRSSVMRSTIISVWRTPENRSPTTQLLEDAAGLLARDGRSRRSECWVPRNAARRTWNRTGFTQ